MEQKEILTERQKKVIELVAHNTLQNYIYLSGGTALAQYYLHHRLSDDLDFFSLEKIDMNVLAGFIEEAKETLGAKKVSYERLFDRNLYFFSFGKDEELKMEFTKYSFKPLDKKIKRNEIAIDSFRDIAAGKLMALLDRFDPKDFADLYFILKKRSLALVRKDAEKKFGINISNLFLGSELLKVDRIHALPKMIIPLTINDLRNKIIDEAKKLGAHLMK